jgi:hypothetical protein
MTMLVGLVAWLLALVLLPGPLAARITLGAPLVLVPHLLAVHPAGSWIRRLGGPVALLAGLPLIASFAMQAGPAAALLSLPWLALGLTGVGWAAWQGLRLLPGILDPRRAPELTAYVALAFLAAGAVFLVMDRLGLRPLGFSTAIILLTATHFHFAGFGLLSVACLLRTHRTVVRAALLGLAFGIPFTALAFILASSALNAIGASLVGVSGIVIAVALIRHDTGAMGWMPRIAGAAMCIGFPMGIAWAWSAWLAIGFIDLDLMVRTHGALNAAGVLLAAFGLRGSRS